MKITIEFDDSYSAKLTIDGREMQVETTAASTKLLGLPASKLETTLGGIVATQIFGRVRDIQQAWATACEETAQADCTWVALDEQTCDDIYYKL